MTRSTLQPPADFRACRPAFTARSRVDNPSVTFRRSRIPVLVSIHSGVVSRVEEMQVLLTTSGGNHPPSPEMIAFIFAPCKSQTPFSISPITGIRGIALRHLALRILMYTGKVTAIIQLVKKNSALSGTITTLETISYNRLPASNPLIFTVFPTGKSFKRWLVSFFAYWTSDYGNEFILNNC